MFETIINVDTNTKAACEKALIPSECDDDILGERRDIFLRERSTDFVTNDWCWTVQGQAIEGSSVTAMRPAGGALKGEPEESSHAEGKGHKGIYSGFETRSTSPITGLCTTNNKLTRRHSILLYILPCNTPARSRCLNVTNGTKYTMFNIWEAFMTNRNPLSSCCRH